MSASTTTTTTDRVFYNCRFYRNTQQPIFRPHPALRVKTDVANFFNNTSTSNIFVYYIGLLIQILYYYYYYFTQRDGVEGRLANITHRASFKESRKYKDDLR